MRSEAEVRVAREEEQEMVERAKRRGDYIFEAVHRERLRFIEWLLEER